MVKKAAKKGIVNGGLKVGARVTTRAASYALIGADYTYVTKNINI